MNTRMPEADGTHRLGEPVESGLPAYPGSLDDLIPTPEREDGSYEIIKHPKHYNLHPAGIECITVIEAMTLNVGTAIKHLWRAGLKPGMDEVDDIRKAITYLEFEIARLERALPPSHEEA